MIKMGQNTHLSTNHIQVDTSMHRPHVGTHTQTVGVHAQTQKQAHRKCSPTRACTYTLTQQNGNGHAEGASLQLQHHYEVRGHSNKLYEGWAGRHGEVCMCVYLYYMYVYSVCV